MDAPHEPRVFKHKMSHSETLLRGTLRLISARLMAQLAAEKEANEHHMQSGLPLEDFLRAELAPLMRPYSLEPGYVVDREGYSCGECDVIISDPRLAPHLRPPSTELSRRRFFPFEATYGIVEVKQSLTLGALSKNGRLLGEPRGSLWDACTKLFAYKQLTRQVAQPVRWGIPFPIGIAFFYGSALDLATDAAKDALLREFAIINATVAVEHRVNAVYVLDQFALHWTFLEAPGSNTFTTLQHLVESTRPPWLAYFPTGKDTLYRFYLQLWSTLARTQLPAPDLLRSYGGDARLNAGSVRGLPCSLESVEDANAQPEQDGRGA